jgi:putative transposase
MPPGITRPSPIPTGLSPPAQGCEERATLGIHSEEPPTPKGLCPSCSAMPQSLSAVYIHLVFSTKDRRPYFRDPSFREILLAQLGGISKTLECPPLLVGGVEDHVHLLCRFGRTMTQADWVKELKRVSNQWLKEQSPEFRDFEWQGGYADFSVSQSNLEKVTEYIAKQEQHHRKLTYQDEVRALLRKHGLEFDERYLWD